MNFINENVTNSERNNEYLRIMIFHNYLNNKNMNLKKNMRYIILALSHLRISFFTASHTLGENNYWASLMGLKLFGDDSMCILRDLIP